jgi:hypothetical protein
MINRILSSAIKSLAEKMPIIAITGPRQSGKSTLIKHLFHQHQYFNLEDPELRAFANSDPKGFLQNGKMLMIIDEVQYAPELLSYIQVISDRDKVPGQFILSGSQNLLLMQSISQSLAGRVAIFNLLPFSLEELEPTKFNYSNYEDYIFKGFYPRIYDMDLEPNQWLKDYISTYVERDVRQILNVGDLSLFRQFLEICAGRTGQLINLSEMGNQLGISYQTVNKWLSVLETSFICFTLRPYHNNFNKRIVKSPKLYFYDTGLACALLNIRSTAELNTHFAKGALFENFIINEITKNQLNRNKAQSNYFWNAAGTKEVDLILDQGGQLFPLEIKSSRTISSHFFDGIRYFQNVSNTPPGNCYVVYGGDEVQKRSIANVINWRKLSLLPS